MPLPSGFLEELRSRTPLAPLVGRRVRLARSGRQWKGCCPFHGEKTPSFYVYEDGYHCFGCGAHGDAISFVMQSQGLGFMEAVEQLAGEAGIDVPKPTPEAAAAEQRRLDVTSVLEAARLHYQRRLQLPEGRAAREYLVGRGLSPETVNRFGLGWAGERGSLTADLRREGISEDKISEAGLIRRDEESGRLFELFSHRVMFPIWNRRGTLISFGGRLLGSGQPKYVNGPETSVFSKRRSLYGLSQARDGVRSGATLLVVEGYMDVIAASQAGFSGAVAPLGTALTTEQLEALWGVSAVPVLCFDGDEAGQRAAGKALQLALPMLTPSRSLRLVTLPSGEDPDSLIRKKGREGFQAELDKARQPADVLFDILRAETGNTSPEQRAGLRSRLIEASQSIADKGLAWEYREALLEKFRELRPYAARGRRDGARPAPRPGVPAIRPLLHADHATDERLRILTAILLRFPFILHDVAHAFADLPLPDDLAALRAALETWAESTESLDSSALINHLTSSGFQSNVEQVLATAPKPLPACACAGAMPAEAEAGWWHFFGLLNVERLREEVRLATDDMARNLTPETQRRQKALVEALIKVSSGEPDGIHLVEA